MLAVYDLTERSFRPLAGPRLAAYAAEFLVFGLREAQACCFAGNFFLLLAISKHLQIPGLARYDMLFLGGLAIQAALLALRLESPREVAVLSLFHLLGVGLELFKTSPAIASWSYPEPSLLHIGTVPLYSGFMYSAVASYLMQAWRLLQVRLEDAPPVPWSLGLCGLIYANFFTHHLWIDLRWGLALAVVVLFWRCRVRFIVVGQERRMPLPLSFLLIGFFIWIAENIATFFGAWTYPHQRQGWELVGLGKISSWTLLVIVSFILVACLRQRNECRYQERRVAGAAGIEPANAGTKNRCLTAWRRPNREGPAP